MPTAMKTLHVWQHVKDVVLDDVHEQFVVCPHNPDRLRRPSPGPGALHDESLEYALTWSMFRPLELLRGWSGWEYRPGANETISF